MISYETISSQIKYGLKYLHKNAWTIVFLIVGGFFCYDQFIDPFIHNYRTKKSYKEATNPDRVAVLQPDMKRVREKQQQLTIERSIQAAEEEKIRIKKEREKKHIKTPTEERFEKRGGEGNRLGESSDDIDGGAGLRRRR